MGRQRSLDFSAFFSPLFLLRCDGHKKQPVPGAQLSGTYSFMVLCRHHLCSNNISSPQRNLWSPLVRGSHPPLPQPWKPPIGLFLDGLPCSRHWWNHTVCGRFCLACFPWHDVFEVHPCCNMYQYLIPFYVWVIPRCLNVPHLFINAAWVCTLVAPTY